MQEGDNYEKNCAKKHSCIQKTFKKPEAENIPCPDPDIHYHGVDGMCGKEDL